MRNVKRRDLVTIVIVGVALAVLILSTIQKKGKPVPSDNRHRPFYEAMEKSNNRIEVEKGCITCHSPQDVPLPKKHPPKEQCLICHKLLHPKR